MDFASSRQKPTSLLPRQLALGGTVEQRADPFEQLSAAGLAQQLDQCGRALAGEEEVEAVLLAPKEEEGRGRFHCVGLGRTRKALHEAERGEVV